VTAPEAAGEHGSRLSPQQRHAWTLYQRGAAARARALVRVEGALELRRLTDALARVVDRHEILRTSFHRDARRKYPLQLVTTAPLALSMVDLSNHADADQQTYIDAHWHEAPRRELDLASGPALTVTHVRHSERRHTLLLCLPTLCADLWTLRSLAREIAEAYASNEGGEEPVQYAQFTEWQYDLLGSVERPRRPPPAPLALPFEAGDGEGGGAREAFAFELDAALVGRLQGLARDQGASLASVLLAAWQVQLARLGGTRDVTTVVASAGRKLDDLKAVMGPVARWLPVSARVDDALRFDELLRRVQVSYDEIVEEEEYFDPSPDDRAPVDPVGFEFESTPEPTRAAGLSWQLERACTGPGACRLAISVRPGHERTHATLWHDPRRIAPSALAQIAEQYGTLLRGIAEAPTAPLGRLGLLGPAERARRLAEGRGQAHNVEALSCLHRSFEAQARQRPDALALVCGDDRLTFREVNRRANRLAHRLRRHGVGEDRPVGLCCERSADLIVGLLGILKAGGAYVPLDPHAPAQRLAHQMIQAGFSVLVTQERLVARLPSGSFLTLPLDSLEPPDAGSLDADSLDADPGADLDVDPRPDALASIVFTSGSTGAPKGVAITHRGIANYTRAIVDQLGAEPGLHFATVSTMSADLGNTSIFASLASGGCLHVILYATATDGRLFAEYCQHNAIDVLKIVPSHLDALLSAGEGAAALPRRWLVLGGEALPLGLVERVTALSAGCSLLNHYGPTETTVGALTMPLAAFSERQGCGSVPVGRPLANDEAYVLDERLEPAPCGTPGELYLGGAGLARGYVGQPHLTAERFVPHPFVAGARLYKTGDRARYRPDGSVEFLGRRDHQVKIRGFRVELGEIEARLREHPAVGHAAAVAHRDGSGGHRVVAYVVARDPSLDEAGLRAFLQERLPEYMIPAEMTWLPSMPLTENGKIDRQALPRPEGRKRRDYVAPSTLTERTLATIWARVLGLPRVGVEDDFFDLGGHSLLAIPLMHQVQQELGGDLSLAAIFQAKTVSALARLLEAARPAGGAVALRSTGARPPLFCVDPTGQHVTVYQRLAESLDDDQPVFGLDLGPVLAREPEAPSIRRIAEGLARQVRTQRPQGPYLLLGWSTGGVLALGVAQVLQEQGERVAFLGVLDTQTRADLYAQGQPDIVEELATYIDQTRRADLLSLPAPELSALRQSLQGLDDTARVAKAAAWAQARGFLPEGAPPEAFRSRYALLRASARFAAELPPGCLHAPIHAWWSRETIARHDRPPVDWQRSTSAPVHTAVIAGDHLDAVQGSEVVALVREAIRRVDL
jgi:amino acid adenylation domain-containing protein